MDYSPWSKAEKWQIMAPTKLWIKPHHLKGIFLSFQNIIKLLKLDQYLDMKYYNTMFVCCNKIFTIIEMNFCNPTFSSIPIGRQTVTGGVLGEPRPRPLRRKQRLCTTKQLRMLHNRVKQRVGLCHTWEGRGGVWCVCGVCVCVCDIRASVS